MTTLLTIVHIFVSIFLIIIVLLQSGKGGGMGGAFGGAGGQIFGGRGAGDFLSRATTVFAVVFFVTSLTLSMMSSKRQSVVENIKAPTAEQTTGADEAAPLPAQDEGEVVSEGEAAGDEATADETESAAEPASEPATPAED